MVAVILSLGFTGCKRKAEAETPEELSQEFGQEISEVEDIGGEIENIGSELEWNESDINETIEDLGL